MTTKLIERLEHEIAVLKLRVDILETQAIWHGHYDSLPDGAYTPHCYLERDRKRLAAIRLLEVE